MASRSVRKDLSQQLVAEAPSIYDWVVVSECVRYAYFQPLLGMIEPPDDYYSSELKARNQMKSPPRLWKTFLKIYREEANSPMVVPRDGTDTPTCLLDAGPYKPPNLG